MILPLQGDALMGAVTPRALPWARRSLAFQAVKIAERPYPSCRPLTRGFAAFPDAQRPYTAEGPYTLEAPTCPAPSKQNYY